MTDLKTELLAVREALDRGGFHATARGHVADALYITQAISSFDAAIANLDKDNATISPASTETRKAKSGYTRRAVLDARKTAIAVMGDTYGVGSKDVRTTPDVCALSPANPREILVVNDSFNSHISGKPRTYESFADYREGFFEGYYAASTEPIAVNDDDFEKWFSGVARTELNGSSLKPAAKKGWRAASEHYSEIVAWHKKALAESNAHHEQHHLQEIEALKPVSGKPDAAMALSKAIMEAHEKWKYEYQGVGHE